MNEFSIKILLFSVYAVSVVGLALQFWFLLLPLSAYLVLVVTSSLSLVLLVMRVRRLASEFLALSFASVLGLSYMLSTHFTVLAYGDPYGQFLVLRELAATSHITLLSFSTPIEVTQPYQMYVGWPGIQIVALAFSEMTNVPLLQTSMALSIAFFVFLTLASFALAKSVLRNIFFPLRNFPTLVALVPAFLPFYDDPTQFKYNFPADVMMICGVLLLLESYTKRTNKYLFPLVILTAGVGLTHNETSFIWMVFVLLVLGASVFQTVLSRYVHKISLYMPVAPKSSNALGAGIVLLTVTVAVWVGFGYYVLRSLPYYLETLIHPFGIAPLGISPVSTTDLTSLTPSWLVSLIHIRTSVLFSTFVAGLMVLLARPRLYRDSTITWFLLLACAFAGGTAFLGSFFQGYYGLTLLTVLDAIVCITPFIYLATRSKTSARIGALSVIVLFVSIGFLGFWGNSFAPAYIFDKSISAPSLGEHPTTWSIASSFMENRTSSDCIVTNEVYVTSLGLPIGELNSLYGLWNVPLRSGCVVIDYPLLNASSSYISEVVDPYQGFSYSRTYSQLSQSDTILAACVASEYCPQLYYIQ